MFFLMLCCAGGPTLTDKKEAEPHRVELIGCPGAPADEPHAAGLNKMGKTGSDLLKPLNGDWEID